MCKTTEFRLLALWQEILGNKDIGLEDNFFDLGSNSLTAMRLFEKISESFQTTVTVFDLFAHPTVKSMAQLLDEA